MKCHKFEINLRKEVAREIDQIRSKIAKDKVYLRKCYDITVRRCMVKRIEKLESQLELLNRIIISAKSKVE